MKKMSLLLLIVLAMFLSTNLFAQSRTVSQELYDIGGEYPGNVVYPPDDGSVYFRTWITARPTFVLDSREHGHLQVIANVAGGRFLCTVNIGNFEAIGAFPPWQAGETLVFDIYREVDDELVGIAYREWVITAGTSPAFLYDGEAIALVPPPAVLFDSNDPDFYTVETSAAVSLLAGYPDGDNIYQADGWTYGEYWEIEFSVEGVISDIALSAQLNRQFVSPAPTAAKGPQYWVLGFSYDGGTTWALDWNLWEEFIELPNNQNWVSWNYTIPYPVVRDSDNVIVRFHAGSEPTANGWAGIKDVLVTAEVEVEEEPQFTLTVNEPVGEGAVSVDGVEIVDYPFTADYDEDTDVVLFATPAEFWEFDKWVVEGVEITDNPYTLTMDDDKVVVAHFEEIILLPPVAAENPFPEDGAIDVPIDTGGGFDYNETPGYIVPLGGFLVNIWIGEDTSESPDFMIPIDWDGFGEYAFGIPEGVELEYLTIYSWQVIPQAPAERSISNRTRAERSSRDTAAREITAPRTRAERSSRNTATRDYPIWSFTTEMPPIEIYTLTIDIEGEGMIELDGVEIETPYEEEWGETTPITLEAFAADGWLFVEWMINEIVFDENPVTFVMDEDITVIAHFEEEPVTVIPPGPGGEIAGVPAEHNWPDPIPYNPEPADPPDPPEGYESQLLFAVTLPIGDPGETITFTFGLTDIPYGWFYAGGEWSPAIPNNWSDPPEGYIVMVIPLPQGREDVIIMLGDEEEDPPLPVELSSFTASEIANMFVELQWVTETETNLLGYHVFRGSNNELTEAEKINYYIIEAANSSETTTYTYIDENVLPGNTYYYWLQYIDNDLTSGFHGPVAVTLNEEPDVPPVEYVTRLRQNYPNPFNPETTIEYSLREDVDMMELKIYNVLGQEVRTLFSGSRSKGEYTVVWDGKDNFGRSVTSGIYFYRMTTPNFNKINKMMLLK